MTSPSPPSAGGTFPRPDGLHLEVRALTKTFRVNGSPKLVLDGIDFGVRHGELVCLFGRSGCGKSTLLNLIAGFLPPTAGEVLLAGSRITGPGPDRCVVFQDDALFPWLTVEENIAFGLKGRHLERTAVREEVRRFLALVGLAEFGGYLPREISGGMKQRVALARVLILNPEVLLMDEPFGALDSQTREEMQGLLLRLWSQFHHTMVFVTHDVNEALLLADRVLMMSPSPGRIQKELHIPLPRPRDRDEPSFLELRRQLL